VPLPKNMFFVILALEVAWMFYVEKNFSNSQYFSLLRSGGAFVFVITIAGYIKFSPSIGFKRNEKMKSFQAYHYISRWYFWNKFEADVQRRGFKPALKTYAKQQFLNVLKIFLVFVFGIGGTLLFIYILAKITS
jgi:hypothetical protein